jgi:hypothetical protein
LIAKELSFLGAAKSLQEYVRKRVRDRFTTEATESTEIRSGYKLGLGCRRVTGGDTLTGPGERLPHPLLFVK